MSYAATQTYAEIRQAELDVQPVVGAVGTIPRNGALGIYEMALDSMGVDLTGVPANTAAYGALVRLAVQTGRHTPHHPARRRAMAMDAASADEYGKMFPDADRLGRSSY